MIPTNGELTLKENENAVISCTSDGRPNFLALSNDIYLLKNMFVK